MLWPAKGQPAQRIYRGDGRTDEMDGSAGIYLGYACLEDLCTVDRAARGGDTGDEDLGAVLFEDLLDAAPVNDLEGGDGGSDGDRVKTEQAMAEDDGVAGGEIWARSAENREMMRTHISS